MSLSERLEKIAVELDRARWHKGQYITEYAEKCDLLREAIKELKKHDRTH